jgi:hypothetical protein
MGGASMPITSLTLAGLVGLATFFALLVVSISISHLAEKIMHKWVAGIYLLVVPAPLFLLAFAEGSKELVFDLTETLLLILAGGTLVLTDLRKHMIDHRGVFAHSHSCLMGSEYPEGKTKVK